MKAKWSENQIVNLFKLVETNNKNNISTLDSFREFAKQTNRNALSVRNFYYQFIKQLQSDNNFAKKLNINLDNHKIQKFSHFNKESENNLKQKVDGLIKQGYSIRSACEILSNGNVKEMLRLQNKYRSLTKQATVIKFPSLTNNATKKSTLTDGEITSLFLGLVKLVKESAISNAKDDCEKYIQNKVTEKRREVILLEQKNLEINMLNKQVADLKNKNKELNNLLAKYRIDFLNNTPNNFLGNN